MSEYNEHSSLYENSDYPSRRQAPGHSSGGSRQSGAPQKRRRKRRRNPVLRGLGIFFKILGTLILIGLCTGALLACFAAVYINEVIVPIADLSPDDFIWNEDSYMYYQDKATGQYVEMTKLHSVTSSVWVDYDEIPKDLIHATIAIEDKRFMTHPGVDWRGTAKAVLRMFTGGEISGGSTITQQLIKNMTDYNETTVKRKITEIVRAFRFTQNNSKEDTITYYLNIIPLGGNKRGGQYEGVGAAALGYFGKPVSELTLAECASLISITNNPSKYGPYSFSKSKGMNTDEIWDARRWNKYRQEVVLQCMLEQGYITQAEHDAAVAQELVFVQDQEEDAGEIYTWYEETVISDVRKALADKLGWSEQRTNQALQHGGLRIYTCYDPDIQAIVDDIYTNRDNLNYTSKDGQLMQSSITIIDNATGDLVAIAGQFGEKTGNLWNNYANDGHRQPGSSIKPLAVYSPALEFNKVTPYSIIDDYPYQVLGGKVWPVNSDAERYGGFTTVRDALRRSLNSVAVRIMGDLVTPEEAFNFVQDRYHIQLEPGRMVSGEWKSDITISLALGGLTDGVNTRDMAEAYSVFPNNGVYQGSRTFSRITQLVDGKEITLLENELERTEVIKPTTAWYMNDMLQGVFQGTAAGHAIRGQHAAGKTGTTSDDNDRWFCGYTPYYTAAVWTGYNQPRKMPSRINTSLLLWEKVMTRLHEDLPDKTYDDPGGRRSINYCMDSGLLATEYCAMDPRGSRVGSGSIFPEGFPENSPCPYHTEESVITICTECPVLDETGAPTGLYYQAGEFCPEESKKQICLPKYVREPVGNAVAADAMWEYSVASGYGQCTVHTEAPVTEPDPNDPNNPVDPANPIDPIDPNHPGGTAEPGHSGGTAEPTDPGNPGGTTEPNRPDVSNPADPNQPDAPIRPLQPSDGMAG